MLVHEYDPLDTGASLAKSRRIRIEAEYLDIVTQRRLIEEILPGIAKIFFFRAKH